MGILDRDVGWHFPLQFVQREIARTGESRTLRRPKRKMTDDFLGKKKPLSLYIFIFLVLSWFFSLLFFIRRVGKKAWQASAEELDNAKRPRGDVGDRSRESRAARATFSKNMKDERRSEKSGEGKKKERKKVGYKKRMFRPRPCSLSRGASLLILGWEHHDPVTLLRPHLDANNVELLLDQRVSSRPLMNGKTFSAALSSLYLDS